jgi:hypothetical protein
MDRRMAIMPFYACGICHALLLAVAAPSVDDLVAKHVEALGGMDKIRSIHSFIKTGTYNEGDLHMKARTIQMRPFYRVIGDPANPLGTIHEGYDGSAWEYYPDPGIVVRTVGPAAASTRHGSMFDDVLVDYKSLHTTISYGGTRKIGGADTYLLHVTLVDGFKQDVFLNASTFLMDAIEQVVPMHAFGKRYRTYNTFKDYRPEGGVMMAHRHEEIDSATGKALTYDTIDTI